jgi:hypothetical protein
MAIVTPQNPGDVEYGGPGAFARYPAAAHALLPYNPAALSGGSFFSEVATSPVLGVARLAMRTHRAASGLGEDALPPPDGSGYPPDQGADGLLVAALGAVALVGVVIAAAVGVAGYQTGKAVAPEGEEKKYGWYGVGAGLVGGPIGLGLLALLGGRNRD